MTLSIICKVCDELGLDHVTYVTSPYVVGWLGPHNGMLSTSVVFESHGWYLFIRQRALPALYADLRSPQLAAVTLWQCACHSVSHLCLAISDTSSVLFTVLTCPLNRPRFHNDIGCHCRIWELTWLDLIRAWSLDVMLPTETSSKIQLLPNFAVHYI